MKCIIFDFDGTIADSLALAHEILNRLSTKYGYRPVADTELDIMRTKTAKEFFSSLGISMIKLPVIAVQGRRELHQHIADVPVIEGMEVVLPQLKQQGWQLGILTSNATKNVQAFLDNHNLSDYFNFTYCSPDIFGKAHRIKTLIRKHNLDPTTSIYVGDMNADIQAAQQANIRIAAVSWGYQAREVLEQHHPDWILDHPTELLDLDN